MHTKEIETIYFGGGTPSLLSIEEIETIYNSIAENYNTKNIKEFTLECNPDDITPVYIDALKKTNVNRISLGIQSFDDNILSFINRRHTAKDAIKAVKALQHAGYENISIDLIYGIPYQTMESWTNSVDTATKLGVQHISAYNLSFEENTKIYEYRSKAPNDDVCLFMYKYLCSKLEANGFEHYEISNFSLGGFRSKHNSTYWNGGEYLGLGAGAHSYNGSTRSWNGEIISDNGILYWNTDSETLSEKDKFNDLIITSLRTKEGLNINLIEEKYLTDFKTTTSKLEKSGLVRQENNYVHLTAKGIFISNFVMREYIVL